MFVFFLLALQLDPKNTGIKTLQFALFPLFLPFFPLIYTDILAMLLVLVALLLAVKGRYITSGFVGILSVLARTNNISWFAFVFFWAYLDCYGFDPRQLLRSLRELWVYWLGFMFFGVFLILNGGIAISNQEVQPLFRFETGNVFFLLFLFAFLFLPANLTNLARNLHTPQTIKWALPVLAGAFAIYLVTFRVDHPYNLAQPDYYLRNQLLMNAASSWTNNILFFLPVGFALLSLLTTQLQGKHFYWLYPFTALSLIPFWLIEPRYAFVPFSLFILFKDEKPRWSTWVTLPIRALISYVFIILMRGETFFI